MWRDKVAVPAGAGTICSCDGGRDNRVMSIARIPVFLWAALAAAGCAGEKEDPLPQTPVETPPIIEVFACSDNCPGPEEQYIKRVYDGVTDEDECRRLGGRLFTVVGWGTRTLCEVQ